MKGKILRVHLLRLRPGHLYEETEESKTRTMKWVYKDQVHNELKREDMQRIWVKVQDAVKGEYLVHHIKHFLSSSTPA